MARGDLNVKIGVVLDKSFERDLKKAERAFIEFSNRLTSIGRDLTLGVAVPLAAIGRSSLNAAVEFDRLEQALISISGSAAEASAQLQRIRTLAELPGISFEQAVQTSLQLQGLGFSAERAEETIRQVGNAIATVGGTQQQFEGVIRQLAQIEGKNKILQEDIRILIENAPVLGKILKDTFGSATAEGIRQVTESGEEFVDILITKLGELPRVQSGLANAFENLGIAAKFALASIGQEVNRVFGIQQIFEDLARQLNRLVDVFRGLDDDTKRSIVRFTLFVAAVGPAILVTGRLINVITQLAAVNRTLVARTAAGTLSLVGFNTTARVSEVAAKRLSFALKGLFASIGIGVIALLVTKFLEFRNAVKASNDALDNAVSASGAVADVQRQAAADVASRVAIVQSLINTVQDETKAEDERIKALRRLKSEYPDYFGSVTEDLTKTDSLILRKQALVDALLAEARARAASQKITELAARSIELEDQVTQKKTEQAEIGKQLAALGFDNLGTAVRQLDANREIAASLAAQGKVIPENIRKLAEVVGAYQRAGLEANKLSAEIIGITQAQEELAQVASQTPPPAVEPPRNYSVNKPVEGDDIKILEKYNEAIRELRKESELLGIEAGNLRENEIKATQKALVDLAGKGFRENSKAVQELTARLAELNALPATVAELEFLPTISIGEGVSQIGDSLRKALDKEAKQDANDFADSFDRLRDSTRGWNEELAKSQEELRGTLAGEFGAIGVQMQEVADLLQGPIQDGFSGFFQTLAEGGANAFQSFIDSLKKLVIELLAAIATAAVLAVILSAVFPGAGGVGGLFKILAGGTDGPLGSLVKLLSTGGRGLAEGGIIPPGYPNDTFPARLTSGEAVIPLDKINQYLPAADSSQLTGEIRLAGNDLVIALERFQNNRTRTRGK